ncbi:RnfABCDGE type electron transport complex subunit B [Youxingia wuxianensis]|uniref:Ion-translocating oxidoreductase complex subunit B n=1 Tax=Youxingia wuxianensis TaxID=2763678 RepID=A0A926ESH8_9FIRM|nr:RnfABCDGE type electron transport complex subunit B [Youxingia wuxianensis]MBC8585549.1 RnfABCDGE type electron transport complex subunit B [Youxingia wuxianensis]
MFNDIILPVLILTGIGLAAGIMLALASKFMSVPVNEKLEQVRGCLPGVNCGVCGYAGCDQYAKAIVEDGAKTNRCVPGGDETSRKISEVLGVAYQDVEEKVAFVACKGYCDVTSDKMDYQGIQTCRAASQLFGGETSCGYGCLGYGDCAQACPSHAIDVVNGVAVVRPEKCIGCSICVKVCPKSLISVYPLTKPIHVSCRNKDKGAKTRKVCTNGCIACRKCVSVCPTEAVKVEDNLAYIDPEKCISCGKCMEVCPVHVIDHFHPTCESR